MQLSVSSTAAAQATSSAKVLLVSPVTLSPAMITKAMPSRLDAALRIWVCLGMVPSRTAKLNPPKTGAGRVAWNGRPQQLGARHGRSAHHPQALRPLKGSQIARRAGNFDRVAASRHER